MQPHAEDTLFYKTEELLNIPERLSLTTQTLDVLITCKINGGKRRPVLFASPPYWPFFKGIIP